MSESLNTVNRETSAGLLRRLGALLYDSFLVIAIWMLVGFLLLLVVGPDTSTLIEGRVETNPLLDVLLFALMLGSSIGFYLWFWCRSGQTLGMLAWRIKLVDRAGGPVSWQQALLRWLLAWPAFLLLGLGFLWLYIDPNRNTLHDRWSQSRVILQPKP